MELKMHIHHYKLIACYLIISIIFIGCVEIQGTLPELPSSSTPQEPPKITPEYPKYHKDGRIEAGKNIFFYTSFGSSGKNFTQFNNPQDIAIDKDGYIYIADTGNHRIQKFTSIDGTKSPGYKADIGINDQRIIRIGIIDKQEALMTIDAADRITCPGFIDMHSHSDFTILANPLSESKIRQGVTTEVIGNCGMSAAPRYEEALNRGQEMCQDFGFSCNWKSAADYFSILEDTGIGINIVSLAGHGNIRTSVMGYANSMATGIQLSKMKSLLRDSLKAGCSGMSSGLIYPPGLLYDYQ